MGDPNAEGSNGARPLICAITRCHTAIVEYLVDNGAAVNGGDTPPLTWATRNDFCGGDICKILLARGALVNAKDATGASPLVHAKDERVRALLMQHGAKEFGKPFDADGGY